MRGEDRIRRLRWLCRRGMRELDILLASFLEQNREALLNGEYDELEGFLDQEDDRIWASLQKPGLSAEQKYLSLINAIRRGV